MSQLPLYEKPFGFLKRNKLSAIRLRSGSQHSNSLFNSKFEYIDQNYTEVLKELKIRSCKQEFKRLIQMLNLREEAS
jgi:hypothetical protein